MYLAGAEMVIGKPKLAGTIAAEAAYEAEAAAIGAANEAEAAYEAEAAAIGAANDPEAAANEAEAAYEAEAANDILK